MRPTLLAVLLVAATAAATTPAAAQVSDPLGAHAMQRHIGGLAAHSSASSGLDLGTVVAPNAERHRTGTILMIVGAAGLITGLIADESAITVAGAVVGGVGLFLWLDSGGKVEVGAHRAPTPAGSANAL